MKEKAPGSGARDSNAQAAIVSLAPALGLGESVAVAAAQQSRRHRTSDLALVESG